MHLTPQERRVVELTAEGNVGKIVAARMGISEYTVNSYLRRVMTRLQARSRAHMVAVYLRTQHEAEIAALKKQEEIVMKWSDALSEAKGCLQHALEQVDEYWDSHDLAHDAKEQIDKHAPEALKDGAKKAIDLIDRMLDALTNDDVEDSDTVPDEPATGAGKPADTTPDTVL